MPQAINLEGGNWNNKWDLRFFHAWQLLGPGNLAREGEGALDFMYGKIWKSTGESMKIPMMVNPQDTFPIPDTSCTTGTWN